MLAPGLRSPMRFGAPCMAVGGSGVSQRTALTPNSAGRIRYYYVCHDGGVGLGTAPLWLVLGDGTVVASPATGMLIPSRHPVVLNAEGFTHVATIGDGVTSVAARISPLENG